MAVKVVCMCKLFHFFKIFYKYQYLKISCFSLYEVCGGRGKPRLNRVRGRRMLTT